MILKYTWFENTSTCDLEIHVCVIEYKTQEPDKVTLITDCFSALSNPEMVSFTRDLEIRDLEIHVCVIKRKNTRTKQKDNTKFIFV